MLLQTLFSKPSLILVLAIFLVACKHDPYQVPVDPVTPTQTGACDPDSVYFQNTILPILVSNCTESGCHNPQDHEEGVVLNSFQSLVSTVENARLNDTHENKLIRAITDSDPEDRMPPAPKPSLSAEQIQAIKTWVAQGALNNSCDENTGTCDPSTGTYGAFVKPLIQSKCKGCHSGSAPQGGISLSTYAEVKTQALNGKLYSSITVGSNWMPKGGAKLDSCSIQKIAFWVAGGALEN